MRFCGDLDADGFITATVWQIQDSKIRTGVQSGNHVYSIRVSINIADAKTRAIVCEGVEVNTNTTSRTELQVAQHGQKYIDELIYNAVEAAAEGCTRKWKNDPAFCEWVRKPHRARPVPPPPDNRSIFDKIVDKLVKEMMSNSKFTENYYDLKREGGRLPIVVLGKLTNATNQAKYDAGLKVASTRFLKKLLDSKMFGIVDDSVKIDLAKRITRSSIVEDESLQKEWKSHESPDLFVEGEFILRNELDDAEYYDLILKMHRLRHPGGVVWFGIDTYPVKKGVSK